MLNRDDTAADLMQILAGVAALLANPVEMQGKLNQLILAQHASEKALAETRAITERSGSLATQAAALAQREAALKKREDAVAGRERAAEEAAAAVELRQAALHEGLRQLSA
jgi:hypothetical protein